MGVIAHDKGVAAALHLRHRRHRVILGVVELEAHGDLLLRGHRERGCTQVVYGANAVTKGNEMPLRGHLERAPI